MLSHRKLVQFAGSSHGTVAVLFGLAIVPLLLAMGSAIDTGRAYAVRTSLQIALDAALLSGGDASVSEQQAEALVRRYFDANWAPVHGAQNVRVAVHPVGNGTVRGHVAVDVPTTIMNLIGWRRIEVDVQGEVKSGSQDVEIALVLDNTGSMAGAKLAALKSSALLLVDAVYHPPNADQHVKVSVVPFANYVNVGLANRNAAWMSTPADSSTTNEYCRDVRPVLTRDNCRMETRTGYNDGVSYSYEAEVCDYTYGDPVWTCTPYTSTSTWHGCAGSRNYPLDTQDGNYQTPIPGVLNASCPSEIAPLTNSRTELDDKIDAMVAGGETYIPAGLFWGWTTLSSQQPFAEAVPYGSLRGGRPVRKAIVLMTDGENTRSPNYPDHWGGDAATSNALTAELCTNVKSSGIDIFTVAFEVTNTPTKDLLRACASSPTNYFDASDAAQLQAAFGAIARDMTALHLSK